MNYFYRAVLIALCAIPSVSYAQSNYQPGYLVNLKGDTTKGFINLREWVLNPRQVQFKTSLQDKQAQTISPADVSFFNVDGKEAYLRYAGQITADATQVNSLSRGLDTTMVTDTIFLKISQTGKNVTLYTYTDKNKEHFFIADNETRTPQELIYRIYTADGNTFYDRKYQRQLFGMALKFDADNENLKTLIERSSYNSIDMEDIARRINKQTKAEAAAISKKQKSTFFFAGSALDASQVKTNSNFLVNSFSRQYLPKLYAGVDILANPNVGKFVFRAELAFNITKIDYTKTTAYEVDTYNLKQYNFSIAPQVLYNFYNTDALKVFGDLGASFNLAHYSGNTYVTYKRGISSATVTTIYNDAVGLSDGWVSFILKAGIVVHKKLEFSLAYLPYTSFTRDTGTSLSVSAIQPGFAYHF